MNALIDLLRIGAAPSYTFLLYLFAKENINLNIRSNTVNFLVKYFVRRNVTDFPSTRDLDSIFINLIDLCENSDGIINTNLVINYLTNSTRFANNQVFREKLKGDLYEENAGATRFILCKIEESKKTKEKFTDLIFIRQILQQFL